jgi:hypothetical protein
MGQARVGFQLLEDGDPLSSGITIEEDDVGGIHAQESSASRPFSAVRAP